MAGGVINTGTHPALLWPGIKGTWGQVYNEHQTEYTDLYEVLDSDKAYEKYLGLTGFGLAPIKPEGQPLEYDSEVQGGVTTFAHIPYALGWQVTYEERINNLYEEVATRRAKANAIAVNQTVEQVAAFLWNNGFTTTYYTTWDGAAVFSASHVNVTGGTWSNILNPGADLAESSIEDMCINIMNATDDRGNRINLMPLSIHVATANWYNANRVLKSVLQSANSNNAINVLNATNAFPKGIKMNHYFTAPNAWFVRTNCPEGPIFFWRVKPMLDDDNDFATKNIMHSSYFNCSAGFVNPRGAWGSNGP